MSPESERQPTFIPLENVGTTVDPTNPNTGAIEHLKQWVMFSDGVSRAISSLPSALVSPLIRHGLEARMEEEKPLVASINVVNKCNLHCAGCYWGQTERQAESAEEISNEEGETLIEGLRKQGVRQFIFLGGEPFMTESSRDNIRGWTKSIAENGGFSTVITNGTYGLPAIGELPNTHYLISFDGGEKGMNKVRGKDHDHGHRQVFDIVSDMLEKRAADSPVDQTDVMLAMTVNGLNADTLDEFVTNARRWRVGGIAFSFSTPQLTDKRSNGEYPPMYLVGSERSKIVKQLLEIKDREGDFIGMSRRAIELLDPDEVAKWSPDCPTWAALSISSDGAPIERCIFGPEGDCSNCGCNISTTAVALQEGDKESLRMANHPIRLARMAVKKAGHQAS